MFSALCARRNIRFKHERYANAQTAAAVYNCNRASADSPMLTAFDFVRDEKEAAIRSERQNVKNIIKQVIGQMPSNTPKEKLQEVRSKCIASLTAQGRTDAEQLFNECWPSLKPTE